MGFLSLLIHLDEDSEVVKNAVKNLFEIKINRII